jgi:predicted MFS family arabinose efflux permease
LEGRHLPFFVAAAIAGINAVVALRRLPETRPARSGSNEPRQARVRAPRTDIRQLLLLVFVATSAFTAFEATFALFGEHRFDLSTAGTSGVFVVIGLFLVFFQGGMVHPVVGRFGELGTVRFGLAMNVAGFAVLAASHRWWSLVVALVLITAGQGLMTPALTSIVAGRAHEDRRGATLGLQQSASALARVAGPIAGTAVFGHVSTGAPFALGGALAALALLLTTGAVRQPVTAG